MHGIDQAHIEFDPNISIIIGVAVAFMVFSVALDLRWEHFQQVFRKPKAPIMGLVAQFVILPGVSFLIGRFMVEAPSVALGLLLVACCPGGSMTNYLTYLAKGNVATSVTITAITTVASVVTMPLIFGALAAANPATRELMRDVGMDPLEFVMAFLVAIGIPVVGGMMLNARRPQLAVKLRRWSRRVAMVMFVLIITSGTLVNLKLLIDFARLALVPALLACLLSGALSLLVCWLVGVGSADRRAVTIEAGGQQVGVALGVALAFFPTLTGVAVAAVVYSVAQIVIVTPIVVMWARMPPHD